MAMQRGRVGEECCFEPTYELITFQPHPWTAREPLNHIWITFQPAMNGPPMNRPWSFEPPMNEYTWFLQMVGGGGG
jgi:hypothetical protein